MKRVDGRALALALVDASTGVFFRENCPFKEFHPRLCQQEPLLKKCNLNLYAPGREILAQKYFLYVKIVF